MGAFVVPGMVPVFGKATFIIFSNFFRIFLEEFSVAGHHLMKSLKK